MDDATNTVIGGASAAARNVISGNTSIGVCDFRRHGAVIAGNLIGVDITGTQPLGNLQGSAHRGRT